MKTAEPALAAEVDAWLEQPSEVDAAEMVDGLCEFSGFDSLVGESLGRQAA